MDLINQFTKTDFSSYEDFCQNFKLNIPDGFNYGFDVVDALAERTPDKKAMIWCNDHGEEKTFTFRDMKTYTNKTANYFASLGIKKGDFVMLILKRHYQFWFSIVALHKLGAVVIPATHLLTKKDIVYRCNSADITAIVATGDGDVTEHIDAAAPECPTLTRKIFVRAAESGEMPEGWHDFNREMELQSADFPRPVGDKATKNTDPMLLYFTSGTTGQPKMVMHNYTYPLAHILTAKFWHNLQPGRIHFTTSDTGWGKAVWGKLYGQWICEAVVFVYDYSAKFKPTDLLHKIEEYKIESFCAPPTIYRYFIKEDLTKYDLSSLKYCTIAGEPLNPEIYNQFLKATGLKLHEGFGQTETVLAVATTPWLEPKPGSMGKPMPMLGVDLVKPDGEPCREGEEGEIVLRANKDMPVGVFMGYHKDPERTESVWEGGIYHTGDIAWKDEDGYLWYVGRTDDVIKCSGYRIGPFEVESALLEHPAVLETAITAVPDELRGQVVKATIVLAKGYSPSEELKKELQNHVKRTTAPYKYPRIVEFTDELPKTISGKIRRVQIREADSGAKA
ncbi:MAG: AMP-binding protein [Clostridia bacterium]